MKRKIIANSGDMLLHYPFLERQEGWTKFAEEFDKPECQKERIKAARYRRPPKQSQVVTKIISHCHSILHGEDLADFFNCVAETELVLTPEAVLETRLKDAAALAKKIECLLSDTPAGDKLFEAIKKEVERRRTIPPLCNIMDVWKALFAFINREHLLPTKQKLNWEANHIARGRMDWFVPNPDLRAGDKLIVKGKNYRAYWCYNDLREDDQCRDVYGTGCKLVPEHEWETPRWENPSSYSHILTPCGLKGLPEGPKGRKVGRS
jgi:hypothetical protein